MTQDSQPSAAVRVAWELLGYTRAQLTSLEEGSTRIVAAQAAGLIALWTTLYTFDGGAPRVLAWVAWGMLLGSIGWLGRLVTPSRLARFWARLPINDIVRRGAPLTLDDEARIMAELAETMQRQIERLRKGLRISIGVGLGAVGLAALAYALEKTIYSS